MKKPAGNDAQNRRAFPFRTENNRVEKNYLTTLVQTLSQNLGGRQCL